MIRGVTDKSVLTALGLSRRLVVRLGVLLSRGLTCTEAALESAGRGSPLEKLLLSEALLAAAEELQGEKLNSLAAEAGVADRLTVAQAPPGRVLAIEEEIEAEKAWDASTAGDDRALVELARAPALASAVSGDEAARAELFSPAEIERLKLTALTSARTEEAVGAMRRLAYAPISPQAQGDVFVRALAALDPQVRAEAARLLAGVGLQVDISEALVALADGDEAEKRLAIDRLGSSLAARASAPGEADLVLVSCLVALTTALTSESSARIRGHVLSSLAGAAGVLAAFPERLGEVLRHLVELLVADYQATSRGAGELLDALRSAAGAELDTVLGAELAKTKAPQVRALLLAQRAALARAAGGESEVADICSALAGEFASGGQGATDQQTLATELFQMPAEAAVGAILEHFADAKPAARRYFLRLLADLCRYRQVSDEGVEASGEVFLRCLQGASKELRLGVFETLLPADPRLSEDLRGKFAVAYIDNFSDLVFRSDIELAESTLARLGKPGLSPLLERMEPSWPAADRVRACRAIGEMGRLVAAGEISDPGAQDPLREAARRLMRVSAAKFPDSGVLAVAIGKLTSALEGEPDALETAWNRISGMKLKSAARLEALSWVACGRAATPRMAQASAGGLLEELAAPEPESLGEVTELRSGGERTLELSDAASDFVTAMPQVVRSLARVALSPAADATLRSRVLTALINRWRDLVSARRIWGPAAATTMIEGLRELACHASSRPAEKLEVIRALGLRLADPPAMRAISEILAASSDSRDLAAPAASAALALLGLRDPRGRIPEEDREHILRALARILGRKEIETSTPRTAKLRERILGELFEGLSDDVPGVYEALTELAVCQGLGEELREDISGRLAARRALARSPEARRS